MLTLLLASALVFVFNIIPSKTTPLDAPTRVRLTWQNETNTTITVTWQTSTSQAGDTVLFDTISCSGVSYSYCCSASGANYTYSEASGYIHNVELTGLTPDTTYYFICGGDAGGWGSERTFHTAPSVSSDVRFVVGGDSRTNIAEREKISEAMSKFDPSFVIHSGDLVNDGCIQSEWDSWFSDVESRWIGINNLTIPIIPSVGNHEQPNDPATKYFFQFALPGNERWYSCDWGPDIHIICLDSESPADGSQRNWLENDLATHANYTWKLVIFHKPPFVSGGHVPWEPALAYWVPLFDKYHVDIVFNGHDHNYQRSYPLNWNFSQAKPQNFSNGTMYVVSGGWGAPLYDPQPVWYMACQNRTYHFCVVDVFTNGTLHFQAKDNYGNTFDEVTIHKGQPTEARARFTYTPIDPIFNETVTFDASASTLNGGTIVNYVWDFGDETTGTGKVTNHTYVTPGNYTVILNVTDSEGRWNYTSAEITVMPEFPSFLTLPLFIITTLLAIIVYRRKHSIGLPLRKQTKKN